MRTLDELVDASEPALPILRQLIAECPHAVEVLACDRRAGEDALLALQVTTRSPLGAIAYETGGLLIDGGWLRVLGAGCERMRRSIHGWNRLGAQHRCDLGLLVADDAVGGFFAWMSDTRTIAYLAPETLEWEDLELGYQGWLELMLADRLAAFYEDLRWCGWREEVATLAPNEALSFVPLLVFRESKPLERCSRAPIPIEEMWVFSQDMAEQLRGVPDGERVCIRVAPED